MKENKNIKIVIFQLLKIDKNFKYGAPGMRRNAGKLCFVFNNINRIQMSIVYHNLQIMFTRKMVT